MLCLVAFTLTKVVTHNHNYDTFTRVSRPYRRDQYEFITQPWPRNIVLNENIYRLTMQMTSLALQSVSSLRAPANIQWISISIFLETDAGKTVKTIPKVYSCCNCIQCKSVYYDLQYWLVNNCQVMAVQWRHLYLQFIAVLLQIRFSMTQLRQINRNLEALR